MLAKGVWSAAMQLKLNFTGFLLYQSWGQWIKLNINSLEPQIEAINMYMKAIKLSWNQIDKEFFASRAFIQVLNFSLV